MAFFEAENVKREKSSECDDDMEMKNFHVDIHKRSDATLCSLPEK